MAVADEATGDGARVDAAELAMLQRMGLPTAFSTTKARAAIVVLGYCSFPMPTAVWINPLLPCKAANMCASSFALLSVSALRPSLSAGASLRG